MRTAAAMLAVGALLRGARGAAAIERNFAGSAQLDYHLVPAEKAGPKGASAFAGFTSEWALNRAVDVSQLASAAYAVSGFKANDGALDLDFSQSLSSYFFLVDNNGRPALGGRAALTFRVGEASDASAGASVMHGDYDPDNQFAYTIAGVDLSARLGNTHVRLEYLVRRQSFAATPAGGFKLPVP